MDAVGQYLMKQGDLVKVTYLMQSGNARWYRWDMTAVYLQAQGTGKRRECVFSLRPLAGTTALPSDLIEKIELVEANVSTKYRDGARDKNLPVKRPRRHKGAVER